MWARVDPTRPHPMITMCMIILPAATVPEERHALWRLRAIAGVSAGGLARVSAAVMPRQCRSVTQAARWGREARESSAVLGGRRGRRARRRARARRLVRREARCAGWG